MAPSCPCNRSSAAHPGSEDGPGSSRDRYLLAAAPDQPVEGRPGLRGGDGLRRANQRQVAEGLREVADLALARHVVLLGQQPEVVRQIEQPLEELARLIDAVVQRERTDQPERAGEELALVTRQAVVRPGG